MCLNIMRGWKVRGRSLDTNWWKPAPQLVVPRRVSRASPTGAGESHHGAVAACGSLALQPCRVVVCSRVCLAWLATGIGKHTWERQHHFGVADAEWLSHLGHPTPLAIGLLIICVTALLLLNTVLALSLCLCTSKGRSSGLSSNTSSSRNRTKKNHCVDRWFPWRPTERKIPPLSHCLLGRSKKKLCNLWVLYPDCLLGLKEIRWGTELPKLKVLLVSKESAPLTSLQVCGQRSKASQPYLALRKRTKVPKAWSLALRSSLSQGQQNPC